MKKTKIEFNELKPFYCPVTYEIILDQDQANLSDACLFYYWSEPDFDFKSNNAELNFKYDEYLSILKTDTSPVSNWDKKSMAIKLLLNELEKGNKNLELYSVIFSTPYILSINFCIDMTYKPTK